MGKMGRVRLASGYFLRTDAQVFTNASVYPFATSMQMVVTPGQLVRISSSLARSATLVPALAATYGRHSGDALAKSFHWSIE